MNFGHSAFTELSGIGGLMDPPDVQGLLVFAGYYHAYGHNLASVDRFFAKGNVRSAL